VLLGSYRKVEPGSRLGVLAKSDPEPFLNVVVIDSGVEAEGGSGRGASRSSTDL